LDREDAKEFIIEKTATDAITSIKIDTRIADVELISSDNFYVEINYLYWDEEPEYSLEDGKLIFDDRNSLPDSYSIDFHLDNSVKIYLPEAAAMERVSIDNSSGNVILAGFAADDLKAEVAYGDFTMNNAAAKKADIRLSSGKSDISDFWSGELKFENSYGNADFTNINTGESLLSPDIELNKVDINMSSGSVDINGLRTKTLDIENSYGNVTCENLTADTFDADLSSGELRVRKADCKKSSISNSYGDVNLKLSGSQDDYFLDLDTSYGNITVAGESYDDHVVLDKGGSRVVTADLSSGDIEVTFE
jgi:DUF4097 and DUF4098 domain-containing protein YvlB